VLLRHGESTWNAENLFTGWTDVDLTAKGVAEARQAGALLAAEAEASVTPACHSDSDFCRWPPQAIGGGGHHYARDRARPRAAPPR